jgi:Fic family protein
VTAIETVDRIEPALLEDAPAEITDVVAELSAKAATLGATLHAQTSSNLADLVRIMNTYYSNLIEGHHTRPRDIERALSGEFDQDEKRRDLQLEAKAHVRIQAEVDELFADGRLSDPTSSKFILYLHR